MNAPNQIVSGAKGSAADQNSAPAPPSISLRKGGGAIRGMGEKFAANPVTGTGSMSVPIATSPGRSGFGPQLALSYDSGAGNGPFGFGWSLSLPSITRKTEKGLPKYEDTNDSDIFILSGAEDLVPEYRQDADGSWVKKHAEYHQDPGELWVRDEKGQLVIHEDERDGYRVRRYRPRIEGLFARIERWTRQSDGDVYWRSISKDNITTCYGKTEESRIANPENPSQIFSWLICQSYDDKGNAIVYKYEPEDSERIFEDQQGQLVALAHERNRNDATRSANRYLKRIKYGNRKPNRDLATWKATDPAQLPDDIWMFEVVLDYGEGHYKEEAPDSNKQIFVLAQIDSPSGSHWPVRQDPFSSYRAGFEVRTYRLCRRVLMFHHFLDELGTPDYLVRSTEFTYSQSPIASFITEVTQSGYVRRPNEKYLKKSLPPLAFEYSQAIISEEVHDVDPKSLENLPVGADGAGYQWLDLDGEGLQCVLAEQEDGWYYKRNVSPLSFKFEDGKPTSTARFDPVTEVATLPSFAETLGQRHQFLDLAGDGQLDCVVLERPVAGFFERTHEQNWEPFKPLPSLPNLDWSEPNLRFIDLTGDGHADILITEDDVLTWYPSMGEEGFGPAERVHQSSEEEKGPRLVFANGEQSIYLADLSGDGLTDIVRIRNGEVCYWPNLGYGRFGAKVTMDNAPWFDAPDQFDQKRIRLADIDGSGTTDIIYLHGDGVDIYRNQCGNGWSDAERLSSLPVVNNVSSIQAVDLLGNGTACLVWSSPLPGDASRSMRYIDLMEEKPHLLVGIKNNLGAETKIHYAPSTKFYLDDKQDGKPWITRLPFPVHIVDRVETLDLISRNRFVTRHAYHHGFYDHVEREFRGFGMVDQLDTEELAALTESGDFPDAANIDAASYVPTVLTKTWFHTGAYVEGGRISRHFEDEYYHEGDESEGFSGLTDEQLEAMLLPDTKLPNTLKRQDGSSIPWELTADEMREACRALKGAVLRREIYALDRTDDEDRPYSATEQNYTIELLQPQGDDKHAVFFTHARESIDFHYERKLFKVSGGTLADPTNPPLGAKDAADPRVAHAMTLAVDGYGNVLNSVAIAYGRRYDDSSQLLTPQDRDKQKQIHATYTENAVTNSVDEADDYRTPLLWEVRTYELLKVVPDSNLPDITNLFGFEEMVGKAGQASDGSHDLPYEDIDAIGATANHPYRRLIEYVRALYRRNDLSAPLPLGKLDSSAIRFESYKLAFTPALLAKVYGTKVTDLMLNEGGYVHSEGDNRWWIPSGKVFFYINANITNPTVTAPQELSQARAHFFLPRKFADPFNQSTTVDYDVHDLLVIKSEDALHNTVNAANDYRVLQPQLVTDPNGNRSEVAFDALGMVAGTAVMGKAPQSPDDPQEGDYLDEFEADLDAATISNHLSDPLGRQDPLNDPHLILTGATTRLVYDLFAYQRTQADLQPQPAVVYILARETHAREPGGDQTRIQHSFSYSDGFGREIQKKIQAEPGAVPRRDASGNIIVGPDGQPEMTFNDVSPRWVGGGWMVFNNKGKLVRQYEPFFTNTHRFEFAVKIGVSPVLFYDPLERVVATLQPNHTYEKVVFDPWRQETWDLTDTVLIADPKTDGDMGDFFSRLPDADYLPTWYTQRQGGALGAQEQDAARKAAVHAATPRVAHTDSLGRTCLTLAHNKFKYSNTPPADPAVEEFYLTGVTLDIEGNQRELIDAKDRVVIRYDYDMLSNRIHQASMEAGERWMVNDVAGRPLYAWDRRGFMRRMTYDELRRSTGLFVTENGNKRQAERTIYGEGQGDANNHRTRVFQTFDAAGIVTSWKYDFKGNLLRSTCDLLPDYKSKVDWQHNPATNDGTFVTSTEYDALNRPTAVTAPENSVYRPTFNEANLLERVEVNLRGAAQATPFVTDIDYNAKGQRELIAYGNGAKTAYEYDPHTFRLIRMKTTRQPGLNGLLSKLFNDPKVVQDLHFTYDPKGNITRIADTSLVRLSSTGPADNSPCDYIYDAIYRLIEASGREHIGQTEHDFSPPDGNRRDWPFFGSHAHPNDLQAMRRYIERYEYDAVGNFELMRHFANGGGWTRGYEYNAASLLEPTKMSNRLTKATVGNGVNFPEIYTYTDAEGNDVDGCMTAINSMEMVWDFKDQLSHVHLGGGGAAYYVYDVSGQRVRKVIETQSGTRKNERIYLGGFEIYHEYDGSGTSVALERETLHIMDDKQRIALVESKTKDISVPVSTLPATLIRYQFSSHLGSTSLELDEQAQIISYEEYYPYGSTSYQAVRSQTETPRRYCYTGKERDEETGFTYHGARYYAPWLGRWTACDPSGTSADVDLYCYSLNRPTSLIDPNGEEPNAPYVDPFAEEMKLLIGDTRISSERQAEEYAGKRKAVEARYRAREGAPQSSSPKAVPKNPQHAIRSTTLEERAQGSMVRVKFGQKTELMTEEGYANLISLGLVPPGAEVVERSLTDYEVKVLEERFAKRFEKEISKVVRPKLDTRAIDAVVTPAVEASEAEFGGTLILQPPDLPSQQQGRTDAVTSSGQSDNTFDSPGAMQVYRRAARMQFQLRRAGAKDFGYPGAAYASHAEKKRAEFGRIRFSLRRMRFEMETIETNREMCPDCLRYFEARARRDARAFPGMTFRIEDPSATYIVTPRTTTVLPRTPLRSLRSMAESAVP